MHAANAWRYNQVIVAIFSLSLTFQALTTQANAEEQDPLEIKEVVISSSRLPDVPVDKLAVPSKVTVITSEDIQKSGAKTVQEAIQDSTGIVMYDQIGNSFEQSIDFRGFNGNPNPSTTVFVDGVPVNEPGFNTINFHLIPIESIERIEILPGASPIYGKFALGGVINITTKRGTDKRQATMETVFGSFHRERYTINTSGPMGKFDYFTSFSREIENGFREESDARISRFFGKVGFRPTDRTDLTVSYTYVKDRLLQAGSLTLDQVAKNRDDNDAPGDFVDNEINFVRVNARQKLPFGVSVVANAFYRRLARETLLVGRFGSSPTETKTESRGGTLQLTQESALLGRRNVLVLGAEVVRNDISRPVTFTGKNSVNEDITGLYAQETFHLVPELILSAGLRYDHDQFSFINNTDPSQNNALHYNRTSSKAGLTYLVSPKASVYFSYSEGFRTPTPDEIFGAFSINPNLKSVRARNYELGLKSQLGAWGELELSLYQADVRDEIFTTCTVCVGAAPDFQNLNVDKTRRRGIEATLKAKYNQKIDGVVNYSFTEAQFRTKFNLSASESVDAGDSFPLVPKHRLSLTGNIHPTKEWTASLSGLYVSTRFHLLDAGNVNPRLPGYFLLNGRVSYTRPVPGGRLSGFLMVNNILDVEYPSWGLFFGERFVVPAPPIAVYGGLSYQFEGFSK